jgi:hypothetical protein
MEALQHESHRLYRYQTFCQLYGIEKFQKFVALYDIDELMDLLPINPTSFQKLILNRLIGTIALEGYSGYEKSNNTFELIQRWQEQICTPCRASSC